MPSNHRALSAAMQPSLSIAAAEHMNIVSQQERVADSLCSQPVSRSAGNAALIRFGRNPKWLKPVWECLGKVCPLCTRKLEKGIEILYTLLFLSRFPLPTRIRLSGRSSETIPPPEGRSRYSRFTTVERLNATFRLVCVT